MELVWGKSLFAFPYRSIKTIGGSPVSFLEIKQHHKVDSQVLCSLKCFCSQAIKYSNIGEQRTEKSVPEHDENLQAKVF